MVRGYGGVGWGATMGKGSRGGFKIHFLFHALFLPPPSTCEWQIWAAIILNLFKLMMRRQHKEFRKTLKTAPHVQFTFIVWTWVLTMSRLSNCALQIFLNTNSNVWGATNLWWNKGEDRQGLNRWKPLLNRTWVKWAAGIVRVGQSRIYPGKSTHGRDTTQWESQYTTHGTPRYKWKGWASPSFSTCRALRSDCLHL